MSSTCYLSYTKKENRFNLGRPMSGLVFGFVSILMRHGHGAVACYVGDSLRPRVWYFCVTDSSSTKAQQL
jgi:hypothetical protein